MMQLRLDTGCDFRFTEMRGKLKVQMDLFFSQIYIRILEQKQVLQEIERECHVFADPYVYMY